jgi:hypothetical protein
VLLIAQQDTEASAKGEVRYGLLTVAAVIT